MMIIFWDKDGVLLTEYLSRGTTINGPYYASTIERLHFVILEKQRDKVSRAVLLLHDNTPHLQVQCCSDCYSTGWLHRTELSGLPSRYCTELITTCSQT